MKSLGWANVMRMGVKCFSGGFLCVNWDKPAVTNFIFSVWVGTGHQATVCTCFIWPGTALASVGK